MSEVLGHCGMWRHGAVENLPHPQRATCSDWKPLGQHPVVKCVRCLHEWVSRLPEGELPKKCGVCGGHGVGANGETMIVVTGTWSPNG